MTGRTVSDIIEACQEQAGVTERELRHALLCLYYDSQLATQHDFATVSDTTLRRRAQENFERRFRMLRAAPATYLGAQYTPGTPENTKRREQSKRLVAAFEKSRGGKS